MIGAACARRALGTMTKHTKDTIRAIKPDQQDFEAVEKEYGPLPPTASRQAAKVIRQLEQVAFSGKTNSRKAEQ